MKRGGVPRLGAGGGARPPPGGAPPPAPKIKAGGGAAPPPAIGYAELCKSGLPYSSRSSGGSIGRFM